MSLQQAATRTADPKSLQGSMAKATADNEHKLIAETKLGRSEAFGKLYERHRPRIYQTALRILRNEQDAEDAAQRSFQRAFTNLKRFRGDSAFSTWLTRIAINEALMLLRQRRSKTRLFEPDGDHDHGYDYESSVANLADKRPTPEEIHAENELRRALIQAVSQLRKNLRSVVLPQLQGLTLKETARHLGLSVMAVKGRVFYAKRCLRQQLERGLQAPHYLSIMDVLPACRHSSPIESPLRCGSMDNFLVAVVDDDEPVRESFPDLLREFGFAASVFSSAEEFLSSDSIGQTKCLLLDIAMPGMSGFALQRELKARGRQIPIVFITASKHEAVRAQAFKEGAVEVLLKPFSDTALLAALKKALRVG